uniref:Uncharacterized protein n=1 Tax=Favella ehrenbergii TaxID=182087 RepID=A0A7S3MT62_9SPIT
MLPKNVILVLEEAILDHLGLILAHEELLDLVSIAHPHSLRLFERVHEVQMGGLARIADHRVGRGVVFVVKAEAPRRLIAFFLQAHRRVELDPDRHIPFQRCRVVIEPPVAIVLDLVLGCVLVEQ